MALKSSKTSPKELWLPALRGVFGDWVFYTCLMPLREIAYRVDYANVLHKSSSLSEMIQRELEQGRAEEIAAYLVRINLLADRSLDEEVAKPGSIDYEPKAVGVLTARGKLGDYFGSLPFQTFVLTLTMLQADKIKYVIFNGNALRYGSASIRGITLTGEFDPDDY